MNVMRLLSISLAVALLAAAPSPRPSPSAAPKPHATPVRTPVTAPATPERRVATQHRVTVDGRSIPYTAVAGTIVLKDEHGDAIASMFYTAYTENGANLDNRPLTFVYNGGPGSSSIWTRMGSIGPVRVETMNAAPTGPPPYRVVDNEYSLIDKSDLVFVDAIGTGFSRIVGKGKPSDFFGIDEDVKAFGQFIRRYVTENDRWNSPKFLLGESYGTTRSANLVDYLQTRGMYFNGVTLLSTVLDFDNIDFGGQGDVQYLAFFPTEAATAWYHHKAVDPGNNLAAFIQRARDFTSGPYVQALSKGDALSASERASIAKTMHDFLGVSEAYILQSDLRVPPARFEKELLRDQAEQTGRLDSRFLGADLDVVGDSQDFDPADAAMSGAYTSAFNSYVRRDLHWTTDENYYITNYPVVAQAWHWQRGERAGPSATSVAPDLADAMTRNPKLKVFSAAGYYDLATPFYGTEYTLAHLGLRPEIARNISWGYYESGHMVYLHVPSLAKFKADLARFYDSATAK